MPYSPEEVRSRAVPTADALKHLARVGEGEVIPGVTILTKPEIDVNGHTSGTEIDILIAKKGGARFLAGDGRATEVRLAQEVAGDKVDTVLTIGRRDGRGDVLTTDFLISGDQAWRIRRTPSSLTEVPASAKEASRARKVLLNIQQRIPVAR